MEASAEARVLTLRNQTTQLSHSPCLQKAIHFSQECILIASFSSSLGCVKAAAFHQVRCMCIKVYFGSKGIISSKRLLEIDTGLLREESVF